MGRGRKNDSRGSNRARRRKPRRASPGVCSQQIPVGPQSVIYKNTFSIKRSCSSSRPQSKRCFYMEKAQKLAHTKWLCNYKGIEIIEGHMMPDHMLVMIPPKYPTVSVMGYLKEKSSRMIFDRFSQRKYMYRNRRFWSVGQYVSTVGLNEATIRKYIRKQDNAAIKRDRMTSKECMYGAVPSEAGKAPSEARCE